MKKTIILNLLFTIAAFAGVPLDWSVDVTRVEPIRLDAYHGETLDLSATLMQGRARLAVPAGSATFLWQTNGMGAAWWQTNATVSADGVVRGTFGPAMDTGADAVRFFFSVVSGSGANYRAAGTIALRPSPGASPTTADLAPQTAINFADYQLVNAPWITATDAAESVRAATNALETALQARDNSLETAIQDAARAASNYTDVAVIDVSARLVAATNAVSEAGSAALVAASTSASNYTDAAVAAIDIPSLTGYATEAWVQGRGYLTDHQSLSGYATEAWTRQAISNALPVVPSLAGYATESWVHGQGYLTSHQPLTGYATEAWVQGRGYLTDHQSLSGYATEAYASEAATGAREAAEAYARSLSWGSAAGNTRLVTLDGFTWQDATGTVWQVSDVYGWAGTVIDLSTSAARPITFSYAGKTADAPDNISLPTDYWTAGDGTNLYYDGQMTMSWILWMTNDYHGTTGDYWSASGTPAPSLTATNLSFNTAFEQYTLFWRPVALATNPVDRVIYTSTPVARALTYGTPTRWTDSTGCVWEVGYRYENDWFADSSRITDLSVSSADYEDAPDLWVVYFNLDGTMDQYSGYITQPGPTQTNIHIYASDWDTQYYDAFDFNLYRLPHTTTNLVGRVALTNDLPDTASITNDIADLRTESALVYRLYSGSNVVAEVTNYNSQVHAPSLRLMQLNESNEYVTVWTETNGLARTLRAATNYAASAIADYAAPRAWSRTTSGLGAEAPANTTWISTPTTVIAGGFEYAKFVDSYGEVWVLTSNGMAAEFNPDTNAYFRITADDGTPVFSIEKSDSQVVGAHASGITVGATTITIPVPVVSVTAPTMYWRQYLDSGDWADESSPPTGATVSWSGTAGSWVCTVSFSGTRPSSMFFKFSFIQEGGVVIRNNATTDLSTGIWVNGVKFIPSVSGNNLIWTKQ